MLKNQTIEKSNEPATALSPGQGRSLGGFRCVPEALTPTMTTRPLDMDITDAQTQAGRGVKG